MRDDYAYTSMRQLEREVDTYLSANLLAKSPQEFVFVTDRDLQFRGADISCENGCLIDSKIKNTKQLNEIFNYPSVEITIHHNTQDGWFIREDSVTDAYFFISIFTPAERYEDVRDSNITKLNILLFSKKQLKKHIEQHVSLKQIREDARSLDIDNDRKDYYDSNGKKLFHLKYSHKSEGAVNLVFKRDVLLSLRGSKEIEI